MKEKETKKERVFKSINKNLRIKHYPNVNETSAAFIVNVPYNKGEIVERKALEIVKAISEQHLWLESKGIISDYTNVILVEMLDEESGEWEDYYNLEMKMDWEKVRFFYKDYLKAINQ